MAPAPTRGPTRRAGALALLTACAGGIDLLSITVLGGVFAGIITGNLVHAGRDLGSGHGVAAATAVAAVAAFGAGVWVWARLLGRPEKVDPRRRTALLALEVGLLAAFATLWILVQGAPSHYAVSLGLLVLAAFAMGAQSAWARTTGAATTYLSGLLATALAGWATGDPFSAHRAALIRLSSLFVGALATMVLFLAWPWAAALLPLGCALIALALWRTQ